MTPRPVISVAIPAYNESSNIDELAVRLTAVFDGLADRYDFEIVICENGSQDDTYDRLLALHERDPRFKVVQLVRNFHMEGGMLAALDHVTGDACVIMSADLQDPPELIPLFIEKWEEGYEVVYSVITKRHGENIFRRTAAQIFYWLMNRISDTPVPRNASDFRLVSRDAYTAFNDLSERFRMVRALWGWLGFRSTGIEYERDERAGGASKFKAFATAGFAIRSILASSFRPLAIAPVIGLALSALSFLGLSGIIVRAVFFGVPFPGFGTLVALQLLLFGFLFLILGMISEYVGLTFNEVRGRPRYLVRRLHGPTRSERD
jgi:dolichol-phosphate mannosyltransferase